MSNPFSSSPEDNDDQLEFDIDISDVEDGYRIPAGKYPAELSSYVKGTSVAGNPKLEMTFTLLEGELAGKDRKLTCSLMPSALFMMKKVGKALHLIEDGRVKMGQHALKRRCVLVVKDDEYNGEPSSKIVGLEEHPKGPFDKKATSTKGTTKATTKVETEEPDYNEGDEWTDSTGDIYILQNNEWVLKPYAPEEVEQETYEEPEAEETAEEEYTEEAVEEEEALEEAIPEKPAAPSKPSSSAGKPTGKPTGKPSGKPASKPAAKPSAKPPGKIALK